MIVGTLRVRLLIRDSRSLKDKRQVVRSMVERLRQLANVAVAEVDLLDDVRQAVLGVVSTGPEVALVRRTLDEVARKLRSHPVAEFLQADCAYESWHPDGGQATRWVDSPTDLDHAKEQ